MHKCTCVCVWISAFVGVRMRACTRVCECVDTYVNHWPEVISFSKCLTISVVRWHILRVQCWWVKYSTEVAITVPTMVRVQVILEE